MASASGGNDDNPWRTVIKGNRSVASGAQLERSGKAASDDNLRSDGRIASTYRCGSRSGGGAASNYSRRSGRDTASKKDGKERTMEGGDTHHHLTDLLSREELRRRTKERLCFDCGQPGHRSRDCPEGRGRKDPYSKRRLAEKTKSGFTPAHKKPRTTGKPAEPARKSQPKFPYAKAVVGNTCLVILQQNGLAPTKEMVETIQFTLNRHLVASARRTGLPAARIVTWQEHLQGLILEVADAESGYWAWSVLSKEGYKLERWENFLQRTKTTRTLTGYIKGVLADMDVEDVRLLVRAEMTRLGVTGNVVVASVRKTPAGGVLAIKVDDDANEELGQHGHQIFVGAAGLVELVDPRRDKKALMEKTVLEDDVRKLEAQLKAARKRLDDREASETALAANLMETDVGDDVSKGDSDADEGNGARTAEGGASQLAQSRMVGNDGSGGALPSGSSSEDKTSRLAAEDPDQEVVVEKPADGQEKASAENSGMAEK